MTSGLKTDCHAVQAVSHSRAVLHLHCCWYLSVWYKEPWLPLGLVSAVGCQTAARVQAEQPPPLHYGAHVHLKYRVEIQSLSPLLKGCVPAVSAIAQRRSLVGEHCLVCLNPWNLFTAVKWIEIKKAVSPFCSTIGLLIFIVWFNCWLKNRVRILSVDQTQSWL